MEELLEGWSVTEPRPRLAHIRVPGHPEMARDGVVVTLGWLAHAGSTILRLKSRCLGGVWVPRHSGMEISDWRGSRSLLPSGSFKQTPALTGTAAELAVSTRRRHRTMVLESLRVMGNGSQTWARKTPESQAPPPHHPAPTLAFSLTVTR